MLSAPNKKNQVLRWLNLLCIGWSWKEEPEGQVVWRSQGSVFQSEELLTNTEIGKSQACLTSSGVWLMADNKDKSGQTKAKEGEEEFAQELLSLVEELEAIFTREWHDLINFFNKTSSCLGSLELLLSACHLSIPLSNTECLFCASQ